MFDLHAPTEYRNWVGNQVNAGGSMIRGDDSIIVAGNGITTQWAESKFISVDYQGPFC